MPQPLVAGSYRRALGSIAAAQQRRCFLQRRGSKQRCTTTALQHTTEDFIIFDSSPYIGPIQVVHIEGAGRGVVVTRDVQPGELLLCCHPLAVVTGPQQQRLSVDQLQVQLATNISPAVTAWLNKLYDGTADSMRMLPDLQAAAAVQQQQELLQSLREQQQQIQQQQECQPGSSCSSSSSLSVTDSLLQLIMDVVRFNAYSDLHDDLAAAAAAGQQPVSLIGLYPEFSFINHSCVPNAINWVLPGEPRAMVVRAAEAIQQGQQVTISYLGGPQLLPLSGRRQALGNFGFSCRCPRCVVEEEVPPDVAATMDDIVSRTYQSFTPRLQSAVSAGDTAAVAAVHQQAAVMMARLYTQFRRHLIRPATRQQLLASCFSCLEVIADATAAEGDAAAAADALHKCLTAAAAVTPGSDLHCILAAKLEGTAAADPGSNSGSNGSSSMLAAAAEACAAAHKARYGQLSSQELQRLAQYNRTLYV